MSRIAFNKGLITEATGLTFPENACTDTDNCVFSRLGRVTRRLGIDYEANKTLNTITVDSNAISTFKWDNAGGDGNTKVLVQQVGATLYFYVSSSATTSAPLSSTKLASTVTISSFVASGGSFNTAVECQYASGNGYLFVFHPSCDPFYVTYTSGSPSTVAGALIDMKVRDFAGVPETSVAVDFRPSALTNDHNYNLRNQGWTEQPNWSATSTTSNNTNTGSHTWTIQTGLTISGGQSVTIRASLGDGAITETASVTSYNSGTGALVLSVTTTSTSGQTVTSWTFTHAGTNYITTFQTATGLYPSNADQWWSFKDSTNVFAPATTYTNVTLDNAPAPKGHFILSAFSQTRSTISGVSSITDVSTTVRPRTGTWFQGRVWYAGVDAAFAASGDAPYTTWTENIYFSQIIETADQFGRCHQVNDPTSEEAFDLLPSDGGVIKIQSCGTIFKLFPIQNGMLVFAANGIWFITGSQGIGFAANDYTITKISSIQSISSTSFVDVQGFPMWWNEEGIYIVSPGQQGLDVQPMTIATIATFYEDIPLTSKKYARGDYNSLTYTVQWLYKTTEESSTADRYNFDGILNYNQVISAFYPWSVSGTPKLCGLNYIVGPGGSTTPDPTFKYLTSLTGSNQFTFAEEYLTTHKDWYIYDTAGTDYDSFFITGYIVHGQASRKFQQNYITVYSDASEDTSFKIQAMWDYATLSASGQWSTSQVFYPQTASSNADVNYTYVAKRIKLRGRGRACQFRIYNNSNNPFSIVGWSVFETANRTI
jgi:hypothetical protein